MYLEDSFLIISASDWVKEAYRILISRQVNNPFPPTEQAIILIPLITLDYETAAEVHWNLLFPFHFPPTKRCSSCVNQQQQLLLRLVDNLLWGSRLQTRDSGNIRALPCLFAFKLFQVIKNIPKNNNPKRQDQTCQVNIHHGRIWPGI